MAGFAEAFCVMLMVGLATWLLTTGSCQTIGCLVLGKAKGGAQEGFSKKWKTFRGNWTIFCPSEDFLREPQLFSNNPPDIACELHRTDVACERPTSKGVALFFAILVLLGALVQEWHTRRVQSIPGAPKTMKDKGFHLQKTWFLGTQNSVFDGFWCFFCFMGYPKP